LPETTSFADWLETMQVPLELRAPDADAAGDGVQNLLASLFNIDHERRPSSGLHI
jgi:hypothetical protein